LIICQTARDISRSLAFC